MGGKLGGQVAVAKLNSFKGFFQVEIPCKARRFIFYSGNRAFADIEKR